MRAATLISASALALLLSAGVSTASTISFKPSSAPGVAVSPIFGGVVAGGTAGTNYIGFGVDFSYGGTEGIFNDPPLAFGGVSGSNIIDLLSPVDGRIVVA